MIAMNGQQTTLCFHTLHVKIGPSQFETTKSFEQTFVDRAVTFLDLLLASFRARFPLEELRKIGN